MNTAIQLRSEAMMGSKFFSSWSLTGR
ncbi:hypothetical protein DMB90_10825 [Raoultella planticola]|uniref:Uncharacterized protein n=1 Tax=Raoultella planticola TaxID=575 RepID=A0A5P6AA36_RAOPL|nr:hypothetical protein DMB90_10825 [Raoultella planticola]